VQAASEYAMTGRYAVAEKAYFSARWKRLALRSTMGAKTFVMQEVVREALAPAPVMQEVTVHVKSLDLMETKQPRREL